MAMKMLIHAVGISIALYVVMVYLLKQPCYVAKHRSMLIGAFALIYMLLFGHGAPSMAKLKANLW